MARLRLALWPAGLTLGAIAEWSAYDGDPAATVADSLVGIALLAAGLVLWGRRPASHFGPIATAAAFAWFLGTFGGWLIYLHRGPLAHLVLTYPTGRANSRLERVSIAVAYTYAAVYPLAASDYVAIGFAGLLVAAAGARYVRSSGPERRARFSALIAAAGFAIVLFASAVTQIADTDSDRAVLLAYDAAVALTVLGLGTTLLRARWADAALTGLVVDLGEPGATGALRERLARTLGDPSLTVGYLIPETGRYVDEGGTPVELTGVPASRALTPIEEGGTTVAVLVHDAAVLDDADLVEAVASATRLAVSNVRLQAAVQAQVREVEASRRRIVQATDVQRRRLEVELRDGAERRLARMADLLDECGPRLHQVRADLDAARGQLRELARGIHPTSLIDAGLTMALTELAERSETPVELQISPQRWPQTIEAAVYFLCSESLTNTAKHAGAAEVRVSVAGNEDSVAISIVDDGVGGATVSAGSGLQGLTDRIEALGGSLAIESRSGRGTSVSAVIPVR